MLIGVDATCWGLSRGFGRHLRGLVVEATRLDPENRYLLFVDRGQRLPPLSNNVTRVEVATRHPGAGAAADGTRRSLVDLLRVAVALSRAPLDVLFFPTVLTFVPVVSRARKLVMIHDVTGDLYPKQTFGSHKDRILWRIKQWLACRMADQLLTVSEHSRIGLARHLGRAAATIGVVGVAADPIFRPLDNPELSQTLLRQGLGKGRRLLTYVGGLAPFKNVHRLLLAFEQIAERFPEADLVLVGAQRDTFFSAHRQLADMVDRMRLQKRVHFAGFVPDAELVHLLNRSELLALPSLNEGFGLPALEAAACGCPVVATRCSPLPQLLSEGGIFVDPLQVDSIADALVQLLERPKLREQLSRGALESASRLTWEMAARQLLEYLRP